MDSFDRKNLARNSDEVLEKVKHLVADVDTLLYDYSELEEENEKLQQQIEEHICDTEADYSSKIHTLDKEIQQLKDKLKEKDRTIANKDEEIESLQLEVVRVKSEYLYKY